MCVILAGAPWEGFRVYGPFARDSEAEAYQQKHLIGCEFWWIVPLERTV